MENEKPNKPKNAWLLANFSFGSLQFQCVRMKITQRTND